MAMITGDNPLTACHVAKELKFTSKKSTLVLTKVNNNDDAAEDETFEWQSIDQVVDKSPMPVNDCSRCNLMV